MQMMLLPLRENMKTAVDKTTLISTPIFIIKAHSLVARVLEVLEKLKQNLCPQDEVQTFKVQFCGKSPRKK
jgi:hypothetical protein